MPCYAPPQRGADSLSFLSCGRYSTGPPLESNASVTRLLRCVRELRVCSPMLLGLSRPSHALYRLETSVPSMARAVKGRLLKMVLDPSHWVLHHSLLGLPVTVVETP